MAKLKSALAEPVERPGRGARAGESLLGATTAWKVGLAERAALLIDMEAYFDAAMDAMSRARHCVHLLNWAFEPATLLHPQPGGGGPDSDRIGNFLIALAKNPELDVRVLCWDSAMPVAATQHFFPLADRRDFAGTNVKLVLDAKLPMGACHHQKMIVIDDALAFCGGGDIGPDRWDTPAHLDDDPRREKTRRDNKCFDSRHEVMGVVDGEAASNLGELFRDRWRRATGETIDACPPVRRPRWPGKIPPAFADIDAGVSRTQAAWRDYPQVRENEALHIAAIRAAKSLHLHGEPVLHLAADRARTGEAPRRAGRPRGRADLHRALAELLRPDDDGSHPAGFHPDTDGSRQARPAAGLQPHHDARPHHHRARQADHRRRRAAAHRLGQHQQPFVRIRHRVRSQSGSRLGANRAEVLRLRNKLLAHWLGCLPEPIEAAIAEHKGVGRALEALRTAGYCRLRPLKPKPLHPLAAFVAAYHLGDPVGPDDAWRPWKRRRALRREAARARGEAVLRHDRLTDRRPAPL